MLHVQSTYARHVAERRAYGFIPLPYETWLSWRVYKPIRELTDADRAAHPREEQS